MRMPVLNLELELHGGHAPGPLFVPRKRRMPKRYGTIMTGRLRRLRRQSEARATPAWADRAAAKAIFAERDKLKAETGEPYEVDHIVPLLHPAVCGLHVHWNMRVLHRTSNAAKGNLHWPDMWNAQLEIQLDGGNTTV